MAYNFKNLKMVDFRSCKKKEFMQLQAMANDLRPCISLLHKYLQNVFYLVR